MCVGGCCYPRCVRTVSHGPGTPGQHSKLPEHAHADRCCAKLLMGPVLVGFDVRQHARPESISKRAPSTRSLHNQPSPPPGNAAVQRTVKFRRKQAPFMRHTILGFVSGVTGSAPIQLRPAITAASATCDDVGFRKKPLRSLPRSQAEVTAVLNAFPAVDGDSFRDNRGDNAGLVNRDVVYT